ncbi:nitroreductase family protein [Histomonas meleagridis]|uniref:nitroreductase family protein n=1 Tax=Histomonas meleagridis TaxID=135588 RepID=UPI00355A169B|nr:nitroreductase family protein [Histomonas meleagridis]KAH0798430.1 nitroreductase family protein [Histomonas meleagridis]
MALNALITRRTIRQYQPDYIIPEAELKAICNAAILSPTGFDSQDIDLLAVTDRKKIDEISKITLDTIGKEGRDSFMKRVDSMKIKNPVTGDAGCLICLLKNERSSPMHTPVHEGIVEMSIMIAAREFGLQSMVLGCLKGADMRAMEKVLGIESGRLLVGVVIGKPIDKPVFIPKKLKAKISYLS